MAIFEVIVGNIGTVYSGGNYMQARCKYTAYVNQAKAHHGRFAGENVTLMHNSEIKREHIGYMSKVDPELKRLAQEESAIMDLLRK